MWRSCLVSAFVLFDQVSAYQTLLASRSSSQRPTATGLAPQQWPALLQLDGSSHSNLHDGSAKATGHQQHGGTRSADTSKDAAAGPREASWFGAFDQAESTYTLEGEEADDPTREVEFGWDPGFVYPGKGGEPKALPKPWFHESQSAGPEDAWQSHYPSVSGGVAGNRGYHENPWRDTPEGWVQDYRSSGIDGRSNGPGKKKAVWFDSSVGNIDGFGRRSVPYPGSPRRALNWQGNGGPWVERAVNTTLKCKTVGCTASSSLTAFDAVKEEAQNCRLNVGVHATDYDDDWSREFILWTLNGFSVNSRCDPKARGCNPNASRLLYGCLSEYGVDHLLQGNGTIMLEGTNTKMVDECPYEGNLLSGVATVTCLVRNRPVETPVIKVKATVSEPEKPIPAINVSSPLQCSTPGCTATTLIHMDPGLAMLGGKCKMNVTLVQTDFDDALGVPEQVDFLFLEGSGNLSTNVKPGKNPCTAKMQGKPLKPDEQLYPLVANHDITEVVQNGNGALRISGKISDMVDECASQGRFLLDAFVAVICEPPASKATATKAAAKTPKEKKGAAKMAKAKLAKGKKAAAKAPKDKKVAAKVDKTKLAKGKKAPTKAPKDKKVAAKIAKGKKEAKKKD